MNIRLLFSSIKDKLTSTSDEAYYLSNRSTKIIPLICTLTMTELNPTTMLAFSAMGYLAEWRGLLMATIVFFSMLFYAFVVAKKWRSHNMLCVTEYFYFKYDKTIGILAHVILFAAMVILNASYVKATTIFFGSTFVFLSASLVGGLTLLISMLITLRGGLKSVIRLDSYSIVIVTFFLIACYYLTRQMHPESISLQDITISFDKNQHNLTFKFIYVYILISSLTYVLMPGYSQKVFSAKNEGVAKMAAIFSSLSVFILYGLAIGSAVFLKLAKINLNHSEEALPYIYHNLLPDLIKPLAFISFFLISITTVCGMLSAMATMLASAYNKVFSDKRSGLGIPMTIISALLTFSLFIIMNKELITYLVTINTALFSLTFCILAGFYWKGVNLYGAYASIIVGLAWCIASHVIATNSFLVVQYMLIGVPCIFLTGILFSILQNKRFSRAATKL